MNGLNLKLKYSNWELKDAILPEIKVMGQTLKTKIMESITEISVEEKNLLKKEAFRSKEGITSLCLRLIALIFLVACLTLHVRSLKVFRWEQSVSGGVLVTYLVVVVGLALSAGSDKLYGTALQIYLCCTGIALLLVNAGGIWHRWKRSGELILSIAELLSVVGVDLKRQVIMKVTLCVITAVVLMLDLLAIPFFRAYDVYDH